MFKIFFRLSCVSIGVIFFVACVSVESGKVPKVDSSVQSSNNSVKPVSAVNEKNEKNTNRVKETGQSLVKAENEKINGKCRPANVPSGFGLLPGTNVNEVVPQPKTREEFDEWLSSSGGLRLAEEKRRTTLGQYYHEADFNNDGCQDVVLMVRGVEDKTGEISLRNVAVDVTVQNLRTNALFEGGDESKLPFSAKFARQIKPQETIALVVILGGENGWSWKHSGRGRNFLLYDSIYQSKNNKKAEDSATVFGVIEKNKPEDDYDDLLPQLPKNAIGDCIHTELNTSYPNPDYLIASKRNLIGFDGKKFILKRLPDAKLYEE